MNVRQRKRSIQFAGVFVAVCTAAVLTAGLVLPVEVDSSRPVPGKRAGSAPASRPAEGKGTEDSLRPTLADLRKTCALNLRRPLFDKPPPKKKPIAGKTPRKPVASATGIRLVGIADEPGHSMAMFQKPDGSIGVCAEGGSIDIKGSRLSVISIKDRKVTVTYGGSTRQFAILPPPGAAFPPGGVRR